MWRVLPYFGKVRAQQWQKYQFFLMLASSTSGKQDFGCPLNLESNNSNQSKNEINF